jgi:hypothetical protein
VAALFAFATALTLTAAHAIGQSRHVAVRSAATAAQDRLLQGGLKPGRALHHLAVAKRGQLPRQVKLAPHVLRLARAHGAVFDVRKLKGTVVKRERADREAPGFSAPEALEQAQRAPVVLPRVIHPDSLSAPAPAPDKSFDGLDFLTQGAGHPPDENGDVGPTYYIQTVNTSIGIYDKSTGNRVAAFTFNAFMSQGHFGNLCDTDNFGDPVVVYDSFEDRWFISDFAFKLDGSGNVNPQHSFECFAVSKTGDPVNGGWNFYSLETPGGLGDYPRFGVWPDGIYMSANMFDYSASGGYQGYHVWALNKLQMYAGNPSPQIVGFAGDDSDFTVIPANARLQAGTPPAGSPEYFVSTEQFLDALSIYKFHVNWNNTSASTFTGPDLQFAPDCWPTDDPTEASTPQNLVDTLSIRAMAQAQYSNLGGAESLWVDHTVARDIPTACGDPTGGNATVRWYQANVTGGTVAANLVQASSFDPDGANTFFRFMPALAVDRNGDLAIGYTKSNAATNPQIKYAGRLAGDPANTLPQSEQTLIDGTGSQMGTCGGTCTRWGDYSGMALDPDGCTFWMTGEYYLTNGLNDLTRIGSFHYPGCTAISNGTLSGTVTGASQPLAGATLALGSRTTTTNASGQYSFTVPAGTYPMLTAGAVGLNSATVSTIVVPDGGTAIRDFTLVAAPPPPPPLPPPPPPLPPPRTLTVTRAGAGTGTVTSSPGGINCGGVCAAAFANGTTVSLSEHPGAHSRFVGWSGDCAGHSACVLAMTASRSLRATFAKVPLPSCVVPKVVGKSLAKARAAITKAHCRVGKIGHRVSSKKKKGKVIGQSPKSGRRLQNGAKVNLVVGKGPARKR